MQNINKIKLLSIVFFLFLLLSCNKENPNSTNITQNKAKTDIKILIDYDIDDGTKQWLNSVNDSLDDFNLIIKTNIAQNENYFIEKLLQNDFDADVIISKYLTNDNINNLQNMAGKSFFPISSFNSLKKMDLNGNIYLIPFTSKKKYLLINKKFYENANIPLPKNGADILSTLEMFNDYSNSIYINYDETEPLEIQLFDYAFSLTDGLTIKGYNWASDLEKGNANVNDFDLTNTFKFLDYFKTLDFEKVDAMNYTFDEALMKLQQNEIGIFELNSNDIDKINHIYNENYYTLAYTSLYDEKNYILANSQIYIAVNKNSMENKKEQVDSFLKYLLSNEGHIINIVDDNSIYSPLYNISSSVYDTKYTNADNTNLNEDTTIAQFYSFTRGKEYLSSAVDLYLQNKINTQEFIDYWQQDVLVSKFNLNKVELASINDNLEPYDCSMILAKSIYDQIDCDISIMSTSNLFEPFENDRIMYSSSPYFFNIGKLYLQDLSNLVPKNINDKVDFNKQKIVTFDIPGSLLINLLKNEENNLVYYGLKKVENNYFITKINGSIEKINESQIYKIATNSNSYLLDFKISDYNILDINITDSVLKWVIDHNPITKNSLYTYNITIN